MIRPEARDEVMVFLNKIDGICIKTLYIRLPFPTNVTLCQDQQRQLNHLYVDRWILKKWQRKKKGNWADVNVENNEIIIISHTYSMGRKLHYSKFNKCFKSFSNI